MISENLHMAWHDMAWHGILHILQNICCKHLGQFTLSGSFGGYWYVIFFH